MRVGWDLDGVVYDFPGAVAAWFNREHGIPMDKMPTPHQWEIWHGWGMTKADWIAATDAGVRAGFIYGEGLPTPDAVWVSHKLRADGHTQHIVTARANFGGHLAAQRNTEQWTRRVGFHYDTLDLTSDKTSVAVDVMIEDNLDNYDALDAAGVHVVLIDRPWNHDDGQRRRIYRLRQYLHVVDELEFGDARCPTAPARLSA